MGRWDAHGMGEMGQTRDGGDRANAGWGRRGKCGMGETGNARDGETGRAWDGEMGQMRDGGDGASVGWGDGVHAGARSRRQRGSTTSLAEEGPFGVITEQTPLNSLTDIFGIWGGGGGRVLR